MSAGTYGLAELNIHKNMMHTVLVAVNKLIIYDFIGTKKNNTTNSHK